VKATIFLRAASVLTLLQSVLHTVGGVFGKPDSGSAAAAVLAMKTNHFLLAGLNRSYWDFYIGFGLAITIFLAAEGLIFWLLGNLAKTDAVRLRPILAVLFAGYAGLAIDAATYFFAGPLINDSLIAVCLLGALITAQSDRSARQASFRTEARAGD
jgi:hypothetical protein